MKKNFTGLKLSLQNLDVFYPRLIEYESLKEHSKLFNGRFLDAGCGQMPYKDLVLENPEVIEYFGLDLDHPDGYGDISLKPDILWDGKNIPIESNYFDSSMSTQVLEHCPEPGAFLKEINRVLKKGAVYYLTVPFLWNLHDVPFDEFRYTPFSLERLLKEAGFDEIKITATGGWHASLATLLGAYACRAPLSKRKRKIVKFIALPIVRFLIKKAAKEEINFMNSPMITGLRVICKKSK